MEKTYIGTKIIAAEEMDEFTFSTTIKVLPQTLECDVNGKFRDGYKVRYEDGYVSWSPKEVFEKAYRLISVNELELICSATPVETVNTLHWEA